MLAIWISPFLSDAIFSGNGAWVWALSDWVLYGKEDAETHWALQPVSPPDLPVVEDPWIAERARAVAARARAAEGWLAAKVNALWERLLRRPPGDGERALAEAFMEEREGDWAARAHAVFSTTEFVCVR